MTCLKCKKKDYCSRFCTEHFNSYFIRKFKSHLSKNNLVKREERLKLIGGNKNVLKFLLTDLGRRLSVLFSNKGRAVESFSIDTKAVKNLALFMKGKSLNKKISLLECFTQDEINSFAKMQRLKTSPEKFSAFETKLKSLMNDRLPRRPNLYYCTYNMLCSFQKAIKN